MPNQTLRSSPVYQRLKPRRTRVKTGCLPCRFRRKKCDELAPICSGCRRNHLICSLNSDSPDHDASQLRASSDMGIERPTSVTQDSSSLLSSSDTLRSLTFSQPISRILFEHYLHETSHLLSTSRGPQNPFITCVMPLAYFDSMTMDSVLALSGAHLCYSMHGADIESTSSTHYTLAIRQLKHELTGVNSGEPSDPVRLLLTILLLSITEVRFLSNAN